VKIAIITPTDSVQSHHLALSHQPSTDIRQRVAMCRLEAKLLDTTTQSSLDEKYFRSFNSQRDDSTAINNKVRERGSRDALQLEGCTTARQSFWAVFSQTFTTHAQKLLFPSFRSKF